MFVNIILQYTLFVSCSLISTLHNEINETVESHVYHSSVTFLLAFLYLAGIVIFHRMYSYIIGKRSAYNPDFDDLEVDSDAKYERDYKQVITAIREMDPDVDFDMEEDPTEKRTRLHNERQCGLNIAAAKARIRGQGLQGLPSVAATEKHKAHKEAKFVIEDVEAGPDGGHIGIEGGTENGAASRGGNEVENRTENGTESGVENGTHEDACTSKMACTPVCNAASPDSVSLNASSNVLLKNFVETACESFRAQGLNRDAGRGVDRTVDRGMDRGIDVDKESVADNRSVKSTMQVIPRTWLSKVKRMTGKRDYILDDLNFYLSVYGYGFVIFVVYYAVDMSVLTPSLVMLCCLMAMSLRDVYRIYRDNDDPRVNEPQFVSKSISLISFVLQLMALVEMFLSLPHLSDDNLVTKSPSYICFTYVFPCLSCLLLSIMPRTCGAGRHIRRAFPTAVLIAAFMVLWVKTIDVLLIHKSNDVRQGLSQTFDTIFNPSDYVWDSVNSAAATDVVSADGLLPAQPLPVQSDLVTQKEDTIIQSILTPIATALPVVSIIVEPLLRLALTFMVITGVVNRKTIEITAVMMCITAVKQTQLQENVYVREYCQRALVISACAMVFSVARYFRVARDCIGGV